MWWRTRPALAALALAALLAACAGYSPEGRASFILPESRRDLAIVLVDNPTLHQDLSARLRALIHEEFGRRGRLRFVDREQATALLKVKVNDYSVHSSLIGSKEETLKYSVNISMEAWIESRPEGQVLWNSSSVGAGQSYLSGDRGVVENRVLELAVRNLADRLNQAY